ncbi:hypothetical protein [Streptomyces noursei]|uniref:hypothetical protein n=1 Tax=Streptomyces noursei TaxID=1971 RepID=UPI0019638143|nr:hypothetical protein [Streptomyces noursei]QRX89963.1 hypothetical protein JNO44_03000 [Streptomyces noursei]
MGTDDRLSFCALPPVVVFCDTERPYPLACLDAEARTRAERLAAALTSVEAFGSVAARTAALREATLAAAGLVRALPADDVLAGSDELPVRSPVQGYFGVRTAALTAGQTARQAAEVVYRGIADLCEAPLCGGEGGGSRVRAREVTGGLCEALGAGA